MNSFQSLLDSYNALRKRTYKITSLNSLFETVGARDVNALRGTGSMAGISDENIRKIRTQFNSIGEYASESGQLITAFGGAQQLPEGSKIPESGLFVGLSKDGTSYNFRSSATSPGHTGSLPVDLKDDIIAYLQDAEAGGKSHTSLDNEAAAGTLTDAAGNLLDPEAMARAQAIAARNNEIAMKMAKLEAAGMIPTPELADPHSLMAPMQIYPPGHPYRSCRTILNRLMEIFFNLPNPSDELLDEAVQELQEDTMDMLDWLGENQKALDEALETGGCIPKDPTIEKLRDRFYFAHTVGTSYSLSYGNYQGQGTDPPKMSGLIEGLSDDALDDHPDYSNPKSGFKGHKENSGAEGGAVALGNSAPIEKRHEKALDRQGRPSKSAQRAHNPLDQIMSKYRTVALCDHSGNPTTDNLFKVDHIDSASNLVSTLSENSSVLASVLLNINHLEDQGRVEEAKELNNKLTEVVAALVEACEKYEKGVTDLSKHVRNYEELNKGIMPGKSLAFEAVQNDIESKVGTKFDGSKKCKNLTTEMLKRELTANPIHNAIREMHENEEHSFQGEVSITMEHPDPRIGSINKLTGIQPPGKGVYNVPYATRCVADSLLQCDSPEDMEYMLIKLGIKKGSEDWKLAMTPQGREGNMKYILPISDKYYRQLGFTQQGIVDMSELKNTDYVAQSLSENLDGIPNKGLKKELQAATNESIDKFNNDADDALRQLKDPNILKGMANPRGAQLNAQTEVEQNTIISDLESVIGVISPSAPSYGQAITIKKEIKDLNKLRESGDPTYESKAKALSYKIAEFQQQREIDNLKDSDPKKHRLMAGRHLRQSLTVVGSGPGVISVKNSDSAETHQVTHRQVRNANAAIAFAYLTNNKEIMEELNLNGQTKSSAKTKKGRESGNVHVKQSHSIHAQRVSQHAPQVDQLLKHATFG